MDILYIAYVVLTTYISLFFFIFMYLWRKESSIQNQSTEKLSGIVVGYKSWTSVRTPIVEYVVNNQRYRGYLAYSMHISVQGGLDYPRDKEELKKMLLLVTKLYNVNALPYSFSDLWPLGSKMTVYYNPKIPKRNFVERYAGMVKLFKYATFFCGGAQIILTLAVLGITIVTA